jgi:uncharacterized membrane protein YdbT with pleckstrin-like domain
MPDVMPRRPGFTTGTEEQVWHGKPALRATLYMWLFSVSIGAMLHFGFTKVLIDQGIMYSAISYLPFLPRLLYPHGEPAAWIYIIPWAFALLPVIKYTLSLIMTSYALTTQRLSIKTGILFRTYDQVELFRVRDFMIDAPLYFTILGLGHVRIISRDESLPVVTLIAQTEPEKLINLVRDRVQMRKDEVGVREFETNAG